MEFIEEKIFCLRKGIEVPTKGVLEKKLPEKIEKNWLKVYGFYRSGNNFLMSLLKYNFYLNDDTTSKVDDDELKLCTWPDGSKRHYTPWGKLFGSHECVDLKYEWEKVFGSRDPNLDSTPEFTADSVDFNNAIYIKRNVKETVESFIVFQQSLGRPLPNYDDVEDLVRKHHSIWEGMCYSVTYEDLVDNPIRELKKIRDHFKLKRTGEWWLPDKKVGWNPREHIPIRTIK